MDIINSENIFLIVLAIVWIIGAILQDLRRREVDNLWNFSLIAIALAYRAAVSSYTGNYWFILNGFIGLIIFLILGNVFYYSRLFAGGDAKLVIALGTVLPLSYDWIVNLKIFGGFIIFFLATGSVYALLWAFSLVFQNWKRFKKEFVKQFKRFKKLFITFTIVAIAWIVFVAILGELNLFFFGVIIFFFPLLYIFAKSVEESCMVQPVSPDKVTEGDWLYQDIVVSGKKIEQNWEGVSRRELGLIKNKYHRSVMIKQGIPFTPSFLFGLLLLLYVIWNYSFLF